MAVEVCHAHGGHDGPHGGLEEAAVVARVDGDSITVGQVMAQARRLRAFDGEDPLVYRQRLLEPLVHRLLLKREAARRGYYEDPEVLAKLEEAVGAELRRRLTAGAEGAGAQDELRAQLLAESHFTLDEEALATLAEVVTPFDVKDTGAYDGPLVAPGAIDTTLVLYRSDAGEYTVAEFLAGVGARRSVYNSAWAYNADRLGQDLARAFVNVISPRIARERGLDQSEDYLAWLAERHEEFAVVRLYETEVIDAVRPSEGEVRAYYEAHAERYQSPDIATTDGWSFTDSTDARRIERALRQELPEQVVEPMARGCRSFGMRSTLTQPLDRLTEAASGPVAPGDIVCVIHVGTSWVHRVLEIEPGTVRPFEAVESEVRRELEDQRSEERLRELLDEARAHADIQIDEEALAGVPI